MWAKTPRLAASTTNSGIRGVQEHDDRAAGLVDDFFDQTERVGGAVAEPDERDVGLFAGGEGADF